MHRSKKRSEPEATKESLRARAEFRKDPQARGLCFSLSSVFSIFRQMSNVACRWKEGAEIAVRVSVEGGASKTNNTNTVRGEKTAREGLRG